MAQVNDNYFKLPGNYLFATIAHKVETFATEHPDANIIRLGIGDVTRPLAPAIIDAMHKAVDEMGNAATFRGYGPEQGYDFLRKAIIKGTMKNTVFPSNRTKSSSVTARKPTLLVSRKSSIEN